MKKYIHKALKNFGFKILNISKKEKELQNFVESFAVQNDKNNLVLGLSKEALSRTITFDSFSL